MIPALVVLARTELATLQKSVHPRVELVEDHAPADTAFAASVSVYFKIREQ
jgi:hypothetical protein